MLAGPPNVHFSSGLPLSVLWSEDSLRLRWFRLLLSPKSPSWFGFLNSLYPPIWSNPTQVFRICFTSSLLWRGISCHPVKWCMRLLCVPTMPLLGFPDGASGKEPACQCRRPKRHGLNPWVRKIPWRRDGSPLQYSCLENPRDRGAWWVHRLTQSQTQLKWLNTHTQCLFQLFIL